MSEGYQDQEITSDNAGVLMADLWTKMAGSFRAHALELAAQGNWKGAIEMARAHDVALWQATGEGECTFLKDLIQ